MLKLALSRFFFILVCILSSLNVFSQDKGKTLPQFLLPGFEKGRILMKSGTVTAADLNYDIVEGEMIFINKGAYYALDKIKEIDTVFIKERKFIPTEEGFYEVILKKPLPFFIQYEGKYASVGTPTAYGLTSQVNDPTTVRTIRSGNQIRNVDVPDNVQVSSEIIFWLQGKEGMKSFKSQKQFLKLFPDKNLELSEFIKSNKIDFKQPEKVIRLIDYCNKINNLN